MTTGQRPTLWFHIHIPKTAGSTLRQILSRNFHKSYFTAVSLLEHHKLTLENTREIVEKHHRWLRCYSDHRLSLDIPFDSDQVETRALAFVRNPVQQVVSQYNFQSNHKRRKTEVEEMSLEEFVERKFSRPGRRSKGLQLQRLLGVENGDSLESVKQLLADEKLYLFPLEGFDLACACLERKFPEQFKSTEYVYANKSLRKTLPGPAIEQKIREYVAPDFELHDMANQFLSNLAHSVFQSEQEQDDRVQDLKQRCVQLETQVAAA